MNLRLIFDNWIARFKSASTIDPNQKVIIPGEPELEAMADRKINGIPLVDEVVSDLNGLAERFKGVSATIKYDHRFRWIYLISQNLLIKNQ